MKNKLLKPIVNQRNIKGPNKKKLRDQNVKNLIEQKTERRITDRVKQCFTFKFLLI